MNFAQFVAFPFLAFGKAFTKASTLPGEAVLGSAKKLTGRTEAKIASDSHASSSLAELIEQAVSVRSNNYSLSDSFFRQALNQARSSKEALSVAAAAYDAQSSKIMSAALAQAYRSSKNLNDVVAVGEYAWKRDAEIHEEAFATALSWAQSVKDCVRVGNATGNSQISTDAFIKGINLSRTPDELHSIINANRAATHFNKRDYGLVESLAYEKLYGLAH